MAIRMKKSAESSVELHPVLAERWSPRAYDPDASIPNSDITAFLEAARWAPSANNGQPWRFIVARRGDAHFQSLQKTLSGFNQVWAPNASLFIVVSTKTTLDDGQPRSTAMYDAGLAAGLLTVEAHHRGYVVHQIGGFDREIVKSEFNLDPAIAPIVILAIGKQAPISSITDEAVKAREEAPRSRLPLEELVLAGTISAS
jgi:nitroreductase